jgi:hypothetical protein
MTLTNCLALIEMRTMMIKMIISRSRIIMRMSRIPIRFPLAKQIMSSQAKNESSRRMIIHQEIKMTIIKSLMKKDYMSLESKIDDSKTAD